MTFWINWTTLSYYITKRFHNHTGLLGVKNNSNKLKVFLVEQAKSGTIEAINYFLARRSKKSVDNRRSVQSETRTRQPFSICSTQLAATMT
jgi:hypothetical protein